MSETKKATFGAGCFWGVEDAFRHVEGVGSTRVGYAGGTYDNPSYEDVCSSKTGHAEVVEVSYDPARVSYEDLLETFWKVHDPTQLNRQGPDLGSQYRSVIFTHDDGQAASAQASMQALEASGRHRRPVVTEIAPASTFWQAEEYHQQYVEKQGRPGCHI